MSNGKVCHWSQTQSDIVLISRGAVLKGASKGMSEAIVSMDVVLGDPDHES